jgi:surface antigen
MKSLSISCLICLLSAGTAFATPPDHAPAHGWRKKQEPRHTYYTGKSGAAYRRDFGILSGRCDRDKIGALIGSVTGAVIGGEVAGGDDRAVGMVIGGVLGALLGRAIGNEIQRGDRACMGHALELGRPGIPVIWRGDGGHRFRFTPLGEVRGGCRYATLVVDNARPRNMLACPRGRGEWAFRRR